MTLFDLAIKNVRRNLKDYGVYIGSMVFSIIIYFTFVTLKYSDDIASFTDMKKQVQGIMNASSIILIIFVAIFILYSNSFFLKKRKKEVALYSLLGVRKKQIGFLLFFENLMIGFVSLVAGIVAGLLLSKMLLTILIHLMGYDIVAGFTLSADAVMNTALVFFLIFLFTSVQGYRVIYKFKLIELFQAEKKGEEEPKAKIFAVMLGVLMIAAGYYTAADSIYTSPIWKITGYLTTPLIVIIITVIGTYLLFHSVLVWALQFAKKREGWAWKGLNMMTASQLLYRIRGNAKTLTLIAILSATTITAGGAVFGLYYNTEKDTQTSYPNTLMWKGEQVEIGSNEIIYYESLNSKLTDLTFEYESEYNVIKVSDYNRIAKLQGKEPLQVDEGELIVIDKFFNELFSKDYTNEVVSLEGKDFTVKAIETNAIFNLYTMFAAIVVPDAEYDAISGEQATYQFVELEDEKNQVAVSKAVSEILSEEAYFSSFPESYQGSIQSLGILLFVGSFLGLVFLAATGSIIFFKMMTEAEEDRSKYEILYKVGVNEKEMKRSIRQQVGFIFGIPLIVGILHGAFALKAFSGLFLMNITTPVIYWMIAYSVIYGIYYILSVRFFHSSIKTHIAKG